MLCGFHKVYGHSTSGHPGEFLFARNYLTKSCCCCMQICVAKFPRILMSTWSMLHVCLVLLSFLDSRNHEICCLNIMHYVYTV